MLADELAQTVAHLGSTVVSVLAIDGLGRELLRLPGGRSRFGERADFLDRTDTDAIGLAQGPVDRPCLGHAHFGAVDQRRNIGGIGIAVADEAFASTSGVNGRSKTSVRSLWLFATSNGLFVRSLATLHIPSMQFLNGCCAT